MHRHIPAARRHCADFGWLRTCWLFSFADYYDPDNIQFGPLRVYNDDVVAPGAGFPTHPHREMEIVTIPISGEITHADSMGNRTVIGPGDVQRMSAGTGLTHSEFNLGAEPVHFHQIWILPDKPGLTPSYDQRRHDPESWRNRLLPVASGQGIPDVVTFHTDATIYRARLEAGVEARFPVAPRRRIFVYVGEGEVDCNGLVLAPGDQGRLDQEQDILLRASRETDLVLIDVPSCEGFGYDGKTLRGLRAR